jgi:hypothetical protein
VKQPTAHRSFTASCQSELLDASEIRTGIDFLPKGITKRETRQRGAGRGFISAIDNALPKYDTGKLAIELSVTEIICHRN